MHLFRHECTVTGDELVSGRSLGRELSIFEWHYIPEWHSESNTISIGNPVRCTLTTCVIIAAMLKLTAFRRHYESTTCHQVHQKQPDLVSKKLK